MVRCYICREKLIDEKTIIIDNIHLNFCNSCKNEIKEIIERKKEESNYCLKCASYDEDLGCTLPMIDHLYACDLYK